MGVTDMKAFVINLTERKDRMEQFLQNNFPFPVMRFNAIKDDPGWDGCSKSHLSILRKQKEYPFIIFEDDVILLQSWDIVEKAMSQLPEDWDALWLSATLMILQSRYSENLFSLKEGLCASAIIYNSKRIIDYIIGNYEIWIPHNDQRKSIDVFYAYDVQQKFNCYIVAPLIITQRPGYSDIEKRDINYEQIVNLFNIHACD